MYLFEQLFISFDDRFFYAFSVMTYRSCISVPFLWDIITRAYIR